MHEVWRDPLAMFMRVFRTFGETAGLRFGPYRLIVLHDPEDIRHVFVRNADNYVKSPTYEGLKLVLGTGLVTSEGDFWRRQRKLANPAFHRKRLGAFADTMVRCTEEMCADWVAGPDGARIDLAEEMMRLTFRIVGHTLFSTELGQDSDDVGPALTVALEYANETAETFNLVPRWVPTRKNREFKTAMATLDQLVLRMIAERRAQAQRTGDAGEDLMGMLMSATDDEAQGGKGMTDAQLRDEVLTLVGAGHETTANALVWTFTLLSQHPDVARKVRAEVQQVAGDRSLTLEDYPKLTYTLQVIKESMRLFPPVWMIERQALGADEVGGWKIAPKTIIGACIHTMHRNPRFWRNPEGFDPGRFAPEQEAERPRYAYIPFGAGPRQCIGNHFAMMEAVLLTATIARRFDLELMPGHRIALDPGVTLRPRDGLPVRRYRRDRAARRSDDQAA